MTAVDARPELGLVIDVDTHLSPTPDLWTSRAPAAYRDVVPQIREVDGDRVWTYGEVVLGPARAGSVVRRDGSKALGSAELFQMTAEEAHPGARLVEPRLALMDELGIWAQIMYPNTIGFAGQAFGSVRDGTLRSLATTIYNDALAEMQEESGTRLFGMAVLPWWDVKEAIGELERVQALGLRGVNLNADPQNHGEDLPDLGDKLWDPLWEAIAGSGLPLNFHIGASVQQHAFFGDTPWPSQSADNKLALGSAMIYLGNARIIGNFIYAGILERYPALKLVSVESGIGWIPFMLEALDWQLDETAPSAKEYLSMTPSEYFKRQIYACFWFEGYDLANTIKAAGVDNCMFETDFPHPTCLYPDSVSTALQALSGESDEFRRKVMSENAIGVYNLPVPGRSAD